MLSKCVVYVTLCFSVLTVSQELEQADLNEMETVFENIQENQHVLKNIMTKLILKYTDSDPSPEPQKPKDSAIQVKISDPDSDSCTCVPYYQCDENTKEVIKDGRFILKSRHGECTDPIEVCCNKNNFKSRSSVDEPHQKCGYRYTNLDNINMGNPNKSKLGEFPWTILIRDRKSYECVGSLIHPQVVLTAAHCINMSVSYLAVAGKLVLGEPNEPLQTQRVKEIIPHPRFERDNLHYDLALLVLETPFKLTEYVNTICLPSPSPQKLVINYTDCVANGWGKLTSNSISYERIMKKVGLSLLSHRECQNALRETRLGRYFELDDSFICASRLRGESLCDGDRGAPLACSIPGYEDRFQQVGALSWGLYCNEDPSVFSKTSHVRNWIDEQFESFKFDKSYYTV